MDQEWISIVSTSDTFTTIQNLFVEFRMVVNDIVCTNTRDTNNKRNQNLQESSEYHTFLCFVKVLCSKTLLDDVLVEAPITKVSKPQSTHDNHDTWNIKVWVLGNLSNLRIAVHNEVEVFVTWNLCQFRINLTECT